jgi:hypothetical protein
MFLVGLGLLEGFVVLRHLNIMDFVKDILLYLVMKTALEGLQLGNQKSVFEFTVKDIDGNQLNLEKFRGAKAMIFVNVACACGLTQSHYKQLTDLY